MSIATMTWVWQNSDSEGKELLIELALADFANDEGQCWPSIATIARKARCSERHVQETLSGLQQQGRLKVDLQGGPRRANLYTFEGAAIAPSARPRKEKQPRKTSPSRVQSEGPEFTHEGAVSGFETAPDPSLTSTQPPKSSVESPAQSARNSRLNLTDAEWQEVNAEFPNENAIARWREWREWIESGQGKPPDKGNLVAFKGFLRKKTREAAGGFQATGPPAAVAAGRRP